MRSTEPQLQARAQEDVYWVRQYVEQKSQAAFKHLVERHLSLVYHSALRRVGGDAHLAEDVTQRVFLDFSRKAASLLDRRELAGWLFTSTKFAAAQAVRAERRRRAREEEAQAMNELNEQTVCDWDQVRPVIDAALDELSDADREAVLLRFFENRSYAEVGANLFLSADAARMRVERALEKLRGGLARRGIPSTGAALTLLLTSQGAIAGPPGLAASVVGSVFAAPAVAATASLAFWKLAVAGAVGLVAVGGIVHQFNRMTKEAEPSRLVVPAAGASPREANGAASPRQKEAAQKLSPEADLSSIPKLTVTEFRRRMRTDTAYRAAILEKARSRLDLFFGPLFEKLKLTGASLETFKDLLVLKQIAGLESNEIGLALKYPTPEYPDLFEASVRTEQQSLDADIRKLLGDSGYEVYRRYGEDFLAWTVVNAVTRDLRGSSAPLRSSQIDRLVEILRGDTTGVRPFLNISILYGSGLFPTTRPNPVTAAALNKAAQVLSPTQLESLRKAGAEWGVLPQ